MDGKRKLDSVSRLGDEDLQVKMCACMHVGWRADYGYLGSS